MFRLAEAENEIEFFAVPYGRRLGGKARLTRIGSQEGWWRKRFGAFLAVDAESCGDIEVLRGLQPGAVAAADVDHRLRLCQLEERVQNHLRGSLTRALVVQREHSVGGSEFVVQAVPSMANFYPC